MMLLMCCTQYASTFGKLITGHRTGKGQFSFQSQRKAMPKNAQTTSQLHSSHSHSSKNNAQNLFNLYAEYIMRNAGLDEAQAGIRFLGEIPIILGMQMTPSL